MRNDKKKGKQTTKKSANRVLEINTWFQQENRPKQSHHVIKNNSTIQRTIKKTTKITQTKTKTMWQSSTRDLSKKMEKTKTHQRNDQQ